MKKQTTKQRLLQILLVVLGMIAALAINSFLIGWNVGSLLLFWFVSIPFLAIGLPKLISKTWSHIIESLVGALIFYGLMYFMTYELTHTDFVQIMLISGAVNLIVIAVVMFIHHPATYPVSRLYCKNSKPLR